MVRMPPWPWDDERFRQPPGLTVEQWIVWARATYESDYPEYLDRLLTGGAALTGVQIQGPLL